MSSQKYVIKLVTVGYGGAGKTSLLITHTTGEFPVVYIPTIFDNCFINTQTSQGDCVGLDLWDIIGTSEDYYTFRPLTYSGANVILLCFSIAYKTCFDGTESFWHKELQQQCPDVPIILVGTKIDLRDDENYKNTITTEEGREMADKIGAVEYMEISSLRKEGLDELFQKAVEVGFDHYKKDSEKRNTCILM